MAALNIKSMDFNTIVVELSEEESQMFTAKSTKNSVTLLLDLAFASNVRYLDDHEMYLENIEMYKTLPFASGLVMARGLLDSLMSATFFNASALRLLRQLVTGGASFELEKSLAEGAGLRGGYSTTKSMEQRKRTRVEEIVLEKSPWARFGAHGQRFGELFVTALREEGTMCLGIHRLVGEDEDDKVFNNPIVDKGSNKKTKCCLKGWRHIGL